jgi:Calcineurin-like phosphoesterase/Ankyrin repeats (3 copies)
MSRVSNKIYTSFFIGLLVLFGFSVLGQNTQFAEKQLKRIIKTGQNERLLEMLKSGLAPDTVFLKSGKPLAYYCVKFGNTKALRFLLQFNVDPNTIYKNKTLLMWAVVHNRPGIARLLAEYGTNVCQKDKKGNTAVIMASWMNRNKVLNVLIEFGADVNTEANTGTSALECAPNSDLESTGLYLQKLIHQRSFISPQHNYVDGPYVHFLDDSTASVMYVYFDVYDSVAKRIDSLFYTSDGAFEFEGWVFDTNTYQIQSLVPDASSVYENVSEVFVINDIHGNYTKMREILIANKIIDVHNNWIWGKGHLVINGDVFDRGDDVTKTLWLIYQLEKKARKAGGCVHFLLGNHEIMILSQDKRYLSDKYKFFANYFNWDYSALFSKNTFFGKWLRTHKTVVIINHDLFVHGGISTRFYKEKLDVVGINALVQINLANDHVNENNILFSKHGPFWYRGYLWKGESFEKMTQRDLDEIMDYYQVNHIIVGHTISDEIQLLYENKVIAITIHYDEAEIDCQGLLIEDGQYYKMFNNQKIKLF